MSRDFKNKLLPLTLGVERIQKKKIKGEEVLPKNIKDRCIKFVKVLQNVPYYNDWVKELSVSLDDKAELLSDNVLPLITTLNSLIAQVRRLGFNLEEFIENSEDWEDVVKEFQKNYSENIISLSEEINNVLLYGEIKSDCIKELIIERKNKFERLLNFVRIVISKIKEIKPTKKK